jgi:hypothetical protein
MNERNLQICERPYKQHSYLLIEGQILKKESSTEKELEDQQFPKENDRI